MIERKGFMMVVGRIEQGRIELITPVPQEWEGLAVKVEPCAPDDALADLDQRLAVLHALGPMEFDPDERQRIEQALTAMNDLSRSKMQQLAGDSR